jgi:3'-phosphoadenosine 5'-phosphosulfate sulfotransferase (PAPS reductase)/FAD synthetase
MPHHSELFEKSELTRSAPDLSSYDTIIVAFSGGKDSIACLLSLIEAGVPPGRIELHHHDVDGQGPSFMDWPSTTAYCRAVAEAFDIPFYLSWKQGGFLREMLRDGQPTAPICFELPGGTIGTVGGLGPTGTRLRFPQVSANLSQRYCSAYLKIDVMAVLIRAQPRFLQQRTLIVTGERAQESKSRSAYAAFEPHRTDTRSGSRRPRHVDHWRPVHRLEECEVWNMMRRHGVVPAPAYRLGWSRLSCLGLHFRRTRPMGEPSRHCTGMVRAHCPIRGSFRLHDPAAL